LQQQIEAKIMTQNAFLCDNVFKRCRIVTFNQFSKIIYFKDPGAASGDDALRGPI